MGGISDGPKLDLQKMQGTQTQQQTSVKASSLNKGNKDTRLSMDGSVFGAKSSSSTGGTQGNYSASDGKRIEADSKQQSTNATSDMGVFMQNASSYQVTSQGDMKDSEKIGKDLNKETKKLKKEQQN